MKLNSSSSNLLKIETDSLILPTGSQLKNHSKLIDKALEGSISALIKAGDFSGKIADTCILHTLDHSFKRIILVGTDGSLTPQTIQTIISAANAAVLKTSSNQVTWVGDGLGEDHNWQSSMIARDSITSVYKYSGTTKTPDPAKLNQVTYWCSLKTQISVANKGLIFGGAVGEGMNITRQLGNLPANICTPNYLAKEAQQLAKGNANLKTTILKEADMKELKMGSLLSVSAGSVEPGNLIIMNYQGTSSQV